MADKPRPKPFVVGDSATTAHIREALARGPELKAIAAELKARGVISTPKAPPSTPTRKP